MKRITILAVLLAAFCFTTKADPTNYLTFDGTQYVSIPTTVDLQMTADQNLTVSLWVKGTSGRYLSNRHNWGASYGSLDFYAGGFMCISSDGSNPFDGGVTASSDWIHYTAVLDHDNGTAELYQNGTKLTLTYNNGLSSTDVIDAIDNTLLGATLSSAGVVGNCLNGALANVRFYRAALTTAQMTEDMNASTYADLSEDMKAACTAAYDLTDNYTSLTLTDATGRGNDGTLTNYDEPTYIGERTIAVSASPSEGGTVTGGGTTTVSATITATANTGYTFVNWTIDGVEVSTQSTYIDATEGDKEYVANFMLAYCTVSSTSSEDGRYLTSFTMSCTDDYTGTVSVGQTATSAVYWDKTSTTITVVAGETVETTAVWNGSWMHAYLYIDYGTDGIFSTDMDVSTGAVTSSSDLVSFTYYNGVNAIGVNSLGETTGAGGGVGSNIPAFTIPSSTSVGTYRARFKVDWNSVDPCGDSDIAGNGGTMVDFTIEVVPGESYGMRTITGVSSNTKMGYVTGSETSEYKVTLVATAYEGYEFVNWTLDGDEVSTSRTIYDESAGDKTYTANFQEITVPMPSSYLSFNGSDQYVTIPTTDDLGMTSTQSLTLSFWVRAYNTSSYPRVICNRKYDGTAVGSIDAFYGADGCAVMVKTPDGYALDGYVGGTPGEWTHIVVVLDRTNSVSTTYLNGELAELGDVLNSSDVIAPTMNTLLGAQWASGDEPALYLLGDMANVRYYRAALTADEIDEDMSTNGYANLSDNLKTVCIAAYDLENTFRSLDLIDATERGNDGTLVNYTMPDNKEITTDTAESSDKVYVDVTLSPTESGAATTWTVGTYTVICSSLSISIAEDGTTPEIKITGAGELITDLTSITHSVAGTEWKIISLPFNFNLDEIIVDGEAPQYGTNVAIKTYNAAKRASNSIDGYTASGWEYKTSGTISASQGFAITIDAEAGESKDVVFISAGETTFTNDNQAVGLDLNASTVNDGADANWNLIGTPLLEGSTKGEGYSLYIYDGTTYGYKEYASAESASITPHGAMFLQGDTDFTSMTFSAGATVSKSATDIDSKITLTINGADDEARMLIVDGSSAEFVINEDAMYFAPVGSKVSQIYFVDQNSKSIAASVVPSIAESTKITYTAIEAGTQSIAMTTDVTNSALYLEDAVTGTSTLMMDGAIYEFESAAGTVSNRFTLVAEGETTGIESAATSSVKVATSSNSITVIDAEIGVDVAIFSTNGTMLYNGVITSPKETIAVATSGVLIVRVAADVVKVVK